MAKKRMKLASGGKRFAAYLIDSVPLWIIVVIMIVKSALMQVHNFTSGFNYIYEDSYQYGTSGILSALSSMFIFIIAAAYAGFQLYCFSRAQTIGKFIMGLQVVDSSKGQPIGFGKMLFREIIVKQASQVVFYLGYIWILIDDYSRSWHDKILDTYVVDERLTSSIEAYNARTAEAYDRIDNTQYNTDTTEVL